MVEMIETYKEEKDGDETFREYVHRVGTEKVAQEAAEEIGA
ncbi:MAG: hypothetical protein SXQ77_00655 [Halobacteria archaeon]|nr:hypothetical protein [Halobacteria archaeon]